jgi:choline kinase
MKAVILAAGMGSRLAPLTNDRPKPLVPVAGKPLLVRTIERLAQVGITGRDVIVVSGFRRDVLERTLAELGHGPTIVFNPHFSDWNNFYSLAVTRAAVGGDSFLMIDGDVLYDAGMLPRMLAAPGPVCLSIDVRPELDAETMKVESDADGVIRAISKQLDPRTALGEYVGVTRIDAGFAPAIFAELEALAKEGLTNEYYEFAFNRLAGRGQGPFRAVDVHDLTTMEIDDLADLRRAEALLVERGLV